MSHTKCPSPFLNLPFLRKSLFAVIALLIFVLNSCIEQAPATSGESKAGEKKNSDSRELVEKAHAEIEDIEIDYALNLKRAKIYEEKSQTSSGLEKYNWKIKAGIEWINGGKIERGLQLLESVEEFCRKKNITDQKILIYLKKSIAISYMRMGEIQNCIEDHNHQSCIIPIAEDGFHNLKRSSQSAIVKYREILTINPEHQQSKWLLNLAYMTLGEYPEAVPEEFLIEPTYFEQENGRIPEFENIAGEIGVDDHRLSGACIVEDFNVDGDYDIFTTSWGLQDRVYFYENKEGKFEENAMEWGLDGHVGGLTVKQTDYNNDGYIDIYIMRGAWMKNQGEIPNTLLKNNGDGSFTDVTLEAGLTSHTPTQACAWSDLDKDGWLDLIVANESFVGTTYPIQLWMNNRDGTFTDYGKESGMSGLAFYKAVSVDDLDNDGWPDIYMSNFLGNNFAYFHQGLNSEGIPQFKELGIIKELKNPQKSFPNMILDINNDGHNDILVSAYGGKFNNPATEFSLNTDGVQSGGEPMLYINQGDGTFVEESDKYGLTETAYTMGCNYGDINNDGWLDVYLGTGNPNLTSIVPNKMYLNRGGETFVDVTYAGGFGHIQKGHGVSMTDLDMDGHLDIYTVMGGAFEGDGFQNALFHNPGNDNQAVILRLRGSTSNKVAIGARIVAHFTENGKSREVHRTIGSGASFGANSLDCHLGIGSATQIDKLEILWPNSENSKQTFENLKAGNAYLLTEGNARAEHLPYRKLEFQKGHTGHHH